MLQAKIKSMSVLVWLCYAFFSAGSVFAEEEVFYLDPMIVTAYRYDADDGKPGYYKMDEQKLETGNYENALDVIQELPGITLAARGASGGFNAYSSVLLNGSDRYVVVIDGIRSNWNGSSYNDFDFSTLPADMLNSVEILPAAAGAVYGNAAKGGVIKITTKKAEAGVKTSINLETGSYGRERENILHLGRKGDWSWSIYAQKSIMGDYSSARHKIPSYENTENADVKITRSWGDAADLTLSYSVFSGRYTSKIFNFKKIESIPGSGILDKKIKNIFLTDGRKTENNVSLEYERKISNTENNTFGIYRRCSQAAYDDDPKVNDDRPWLLDIRTEGFFDRYSKQWHAKNTLTAGFEYYQDQVLDYQDLRANINDRTLISKAVYVQNEWRMDDEIKVTGTLRQDYNSYAGSKLSPAAALEYRPSDKMLYTLSYTEYFAPPKQLMLFAPYGDETLKPEEGKVYEFGAAYTPDDSLTLKASIFHRNATNVIAVDISLPEKDRRYANVAREKATGFTVSAAKRFADNWYTSFAYTQTLVDIERKGTAPVAVNIPHGKLVFDLVYDKDKYSAMLQGQGIFDQANGRGENLYANNTYWVWNASMNYKINKNARLYFRVNNIFDQFYSSWDNDTYGILNFDEWYAEPGRNYQVGINYTF
ncbi:TonB-dependent receptor [Phascolarctobacterium faecium]|uniref:TonB-dependent receptor n=1 Tax=Phascolarctobacterium faecium TaxID=33025 RepID=UPI00266654C4|nr:TonB-dependent receptor [Phascolarctobacterium faecium]